MTLQRLAISQQRTGRFGLPCRFASAVSMRGALKLANSSAARIHLPCLPFGYGWESDSRQSGRMTM